MSHPPLRILQLNSLLNGGGTDDQCVKLAYGLHQLGQKVWVAGPDGREFSQVVRALGVPFQPTPPEGPIKLHFMKSAAKFIRQERIQIVHGHHGRDIWPTILAARWSGVRPRIILSRHLAKSPSSYFSRRFLLGQCDVLVAVSHFTARVLREGIDEPDSPEEERHSRPPLLGDYSKIKVIHGGIDTNRFRPLPADDPAVLRQRMEWGLEPGQYAFGVVGGYDLPRGKGQREFLKAAAQIQSKVPSARFLMVGRGNMADILRDDISRLGLAGRAWLTPYCHDMPLAMNALDCLVHPQIGTEAFGLVICEAHACGRPVIASALDGIPEAFAAGGHGRLMPPESVAAMAGAMIEMAGQPPLTAAARSALQAKIEVLYSVRALGTRMLDLYREDCAP